MGFFLAMTWPWWLLAIALGLIITWLIFRDRKRGKHTHEKADLKADAKDHAAVKARNAELEGAVGKHASLKDEHASLLGAHESLKGEHEALMSRNAELEPLAIEHPGLKTRNEELEGTADELAAQRQECAQHTNDLTDAHARIAELEAANTAAPAGAAVPAQAAPSETSETRDERPADVTSAYEVLGYRLKADDLTEIEGIGPKIRDLLHGEDIRTWRGLSQADPARLEQILRDAGPRFQMHSPGTWPHQAGLLADGDWEGHKAMTETLRGGRERV